MFKIIDRSFDHLLHKLLRFNIYQSQNFFLNIFNRIFLYFLKKKYFLHNFNLLLLNFHHFFIAFRNIFVHFQKLKISNCSTRLHSKKLSQTFGCFPLHPKTGSWLSLANAQEIFSILFSFFRVKKRILWSIKCVTRSLDWKWKPRSMFDLHVFDTASVEIWIFCITKNGGNIQRSGQN